MQVRRLVPWISAVLFVACGPVSQSSKTEGVKAIVRQWIQEADSGASLATLDAFLDKWYMPDFRSHIPGAPAPADRAGYRQLLTAFLSGLSEIRHEITHIAAEGDLVTAIITLRAKHTGTFQGMPATGRSIEVDEIIVVRIQDGKLAEEWFVLDSSTLVQQLAPTPTTGS